MADVSINRPGVRVTQEFRTTSPTYLIPSLPACIMGPCFQVIEAVQDDGSLNPDAQITLPARITFPWVSGAFEYTAIGTDPLVLEVNGAAAETVTFSTGPNLTATAVADEINTAAIPGLTAEVEVSGTSQRVVLTTTTKGDNASIKVATGTHADVLTAFALTIGYTAIGRSGYRNYFDSDIQLADYPDPRENIDELVIDYETVRVFINDGAGNVREALRTETFLDGATSAVTVIDDGDGDNLSPYIDITGGVFRNKAAQMTGTVDWSTLAYPGDFGVLTLDIIIDGTPVVVTWASPGTAALAIGALNTQLNAAVPGTTAVLSGVTTGFPIITSPTTGVGSSVEIGNGGTITEATIGLAIGRYAAGKPSRARAQGTVVLSGLSYPNPADVIGRVLRMSVDFDSWQTLTFPTTGIASMTDIRDAINGLWGTGFASINEADQLVLRSPLTNGGRESSIRVDYDATDVTLMGATGLGLGTASGPFDATVTPKISVVYGNAYSPIVGDELWVAGVALGTITEIVTGVDDRVRISAEQLLTFTGSTWTIIAKGLDNDLPSASRPSSDLYVDANTGTTRVKGEQFRDSAGNVTNSPTLAMYLAYTALRQDVSPQAENFTLLRFGTTTELEDALSPIDLQNPLGYGMYIAMLNAPLVAISGCGVEETSTTEPDGSLDGYVSAFEFLESKDVYAIVPLTHDINVGAVAKAHVDAMSEPDQAMERYVIFNPTRPTRKSATLVASGTLGNVTGAGDVFQTGIANLQALLAAAGVPGPTYTIADEVYLELEDDPKHYLVLSVSGQALTLNDGPFVSPDNDDDFYDDAAGVDVFDGAIVDRPFTVKIRGAALANRDEEASAYADIARGFLDRRVVVTAPDKAKATVDGLETIVEGYYMGCAVAGMRSARAPQQPLSNEAITGFTGVIGAQDRYSERQLKIMSGGGLWVFQQDAESGPVVIRHQLTSDMSTVEKREDNIRTALDFAAKFIRAGLKNFSGRFVLTTNVLDAVSVTITGLGAFLVTNGVFLKFDITAVRISASDPTKIEIDVTVRAPYPLNDIDVTLVV